MRYTVWGYVYLYPGHAKCLSSDKRTAPHFLFILNRRFGVVATVGIMPPRNANLADARRNRKDEFFTQLVDIERELMHYKDHFRGKTVLCNCDDPRVSNFFRYFALNFETLGLKRLITTCYKNQHADLFSEQKSDKAVYLIYDGDKNGNRIPDLEEIEVKQLKGDGDFRSPECVELLLQSDIVVTNPPFSLFREYVAQLIKYDKKFLIIGHQNAITYKEIFPLLKENKVWLGYGFKGAAGHFYSFYEDTATAGDHREGMIRVSGVTWYTNLEHHKRHEELVLYKRYSPDLYSTYENYDAIEVGKTSDIPCDYEGVMGVPITFMNKYNPEQFDILGCTESEGKGFSNGLWHSNSLVAQPLVNGNRVYKRIFIRKRILE